MASINPCGSPVGTNSSFLFSTPNGVRSIHRQWWLGITRATHEISGVNDHEVRFTSELERSEGGVEDFKHKIRVGLRQTHGRGNPNDLPPQAPFSQQQAPLAAG